MPQMGGFLFEELVRRRPDLSGQLRSMQEGVALRLTPAAAKLHARRTHGRAADARRSPLPPPHGSQPPRPRRLRAVRRRQRGAPGVGGAAVCAARVELGGGGREPERDPLLH